MPKKKEAESPHPINKSLAVSVYVVFHYLHFIKLDHVLCVKILCLFWFRLEADPAPGEQHSQH